VNINATLDIDLETTQREYDGPGSAIDEELIDEPPYRNFLEESSRGDKQTSLSMSKVLFMFKFTSRSTSR
jgi:hypothetical protein